MKLAPPDKVPKDIIGFAEIRIPQVVCLRARWAIAREIIVKMRLKGVAVGVMRLLRCWRPSSRTFAGAEPFMMSLLSCVKCAALVGVTQTLVRF